ncbi:MAG: hypothetical protein PVJ57_21565 [Phycisphaerae bacterium]|jgi:hypothetical protein
MLRQTPTIKEAAVPFEEQTTETIARVRGAFTEIVRALPQRITRACELHQALQIDKGLGWRIFNVIRCSDPFAAARYVPGTSGAKIFLRAAQKQGVPAALTDTATAALSDYQKLQRVHAGNRKRLDMLLAAQSHEGRAEIDVVHRRLAFEANSYIWGASAETQFRTSFTGFSERSGQLDITRLGGLIGLQRLRPDVRWPLGKATCTTDAGGEIPAYTIEPIYNVENPDEATAELFMSSPRPRIECNRSDRTLQWELLPGPVGRTGAVSCVTGEVMRRCGPIRQSGGETGITYVVRIHTPSELLIADHFIDHELFGPLEHTVAVYGGLVDGPRKKSDHVPVREAVRHLGRASGLLHTPEIPRYAEMTAHVFDRLGWDPGRFDVYRLRLEYPIMLSEVRLTHPLRD